MKANPRRRTRRHHRVNRRHHYRRNPTIAGFDLNVQDILFASAGIVVPPILTGYIWPYMPTSLQTSKAAYYGVQVASAIVPAMLVRKYVSRRAGNMMLIGGIASVAVGIIQAYMPSLIPAAAVPGGLQGGQSQPFLGFYERMPQRSIQRSGLGRYASVPVRSQSVMSTPMTMNTPDRLLPQSRF